MKALKYIITISTLFFFASCEKEFLDKQPLDILQDEQVWNSPILIDAYVTNLYSRAPIRGMFKDFSWEPTITSPAQESTISDEARGTWVWLDEVNRWNKGLLDGSGQLNEYWDYNLVRDCNVFLEQISTGQVSEEIKAQRSAEVRVIRAIVYFEMVKRYGGVPLITEPQSITEDLASLRVPRTKEQEIYDFIGDECDEAALVLLPNYGPESGNRISKYAALALKSRAMLYAASIAKYGDVKLDGLVGIPASEASKYWQASLAASEAIISGPFSLFDKYEDKAENYQKLFLEKNNSEIILARNFVSVISGHQFDFYNATLGFMAGWGNFISPTLEMVNAYEMIDGSTGAIDWDNAKGGLHVLLEKKDPRFHATIFHNGSPWMGDTIRFYFGINVNGEILNSEGASYEGMPQVGVNSRTFDATKTGFTLKKFLNPALQQVGETRSDQAWIYFRLGEILLNHAEAAMELGQSNVALISINKIRNRAGIAELTTVDLQKIRHERFVEMAFENHRYYDLRRWRTASNNLTGDLHGALPYFDWSSQKFFYKVVNADGYTRLFKEHHYYLPIGIDRRNNNPNLVENPGY